MADYYLTSGSCRDFMFGKSANGYQSMALEFRDISRATLLQAGTIPIVSAKPFGSGWNHDIAGTSSLSGSIYYYDTAGILVGDSPSTDFSVVYSASYSNFYVTQAPASPDAINGDQCLVMVSNRVPAINDTVTYTLYARDNYNRFKTVGGDNITALAAGDETIGAVVDNNDGSYSVSVTKPTTGLADVNFLLDGVQIYPFYFQDAEFGGATGDSLDPSQCTITVGQGFIDVGIFSRSGGVPYSSDAGLVQLFSPTLIDIGPGVWDNANNVRFTIPYGTSGVHLVYGYAGSYGREVIAGSMQTYQLDGGAAAIQPRDIQITHRVFLPTQPRDIATRHKVISSLQPRDIGMTHRVIDPSISMPTPGTGSGNAGAGWPRRIRFDI